MEHESFVPIPPARLIEALRSPGAFAASLPGWQPDEGEDAATPAKGRLRLRVGGSTITYRGTAELTGEGPVFTVTAEGTEVRGNGTVKATAEVAVAATAQPEPGATLTWQGSAQADGRLAGYEEAVAEAAVRRLLDRFAAELGARAQGAGVQGKGSEPGAVAVAAAEAVPERGSETGTGAEADVVSQRGAAAEQEPEAEPEAEGDPEAEADAALEAGPDSPSDRDADAAEATQATDPTDPTDPTDEFDVTNPSDADDEPDVVDDLGESVPAAELEEFELVEVEVEVPESAAALDDLVPPAEAAHARRTMIGRSAEEVDHAPPRGRYAPVPAPASGTAAATLRWAAPAAAALLASAVVVGRVLRRRK
jgi:carbon monoxide dehydrogenase subunit G